MFLEHYKLYWTNFVNFKGRTPQAGYWFSFLWNAIIGVIIGLISVIVVTESILDILKDAIKDPLVIFDVVRDADEGLLVMSIVVIAWSIVNLLPCLAVSIRRLHDTGRRWFWIFVLYGPPIAYVAVMLISTLENVSIDDFIASFTPVMPFVCLACAIVFFIIMCLPTSPDAIGNSTHSVYPQWKDGYGGGVSSASIIGVSGMYKGVAFPLDNDEELILGRDALLSHIVITENAEKISRKHLTVSFDDYDNVYTVTDHSSNGTYLADGTRLVANIPVRLQRGTVVYLAKKENSFKLG